MVLTSHFLPIQKVDVGFEPDPDTSDGLDAPNLDETRVGCSVGDTACPMAVVDEAASGSVLILEVGSSDFELSTD